MMDTPTTLVATAATIIDAPVEDVWQALVDPDQIRRYMFGTNVVTDWTEGGDIRWKGEWKGSAYEDKGTVLVVDPPHAIGFSHFSPLTGKADVPENYHNVRIELGEESGGTRVTLTQDNNPDDQARAHSEANWQTMLDGLKELLEGPSDSNAQG
jgi:uncharacterized protein YndB with AHSA1/START domain